VNVLEDAGGMAALQRLGVRSVPVLSRGDKFVFAQSLAPIVEFLGLNEKTGPELSPPQLFERLDRFLGAELALVPLMPADRLATHVPSRPRSYRTLAHHTFKIVEAFLDTVDGATLVQAMFAVVPPDDTDTAALVAYGDAVRQRLRRWWGDGSNVTGQETLATYYGPQSLHELLERTTWHSGQHVRQWMMLLEREGVAHDRPLCPADFASLPMPQNVWDG
jgi:hypothetical protein